MAGSAIAQAMPAWFGTAVDRVHTQLAATSNAITDYGKFPRAVRTDYSIEQLCREMECNASDF